MDDMLQRIQAMERNSIRLHIAGPVPDTRSFTRFGGVPDGPAGFQWPVFETASYDDDAVKCRPLAFLAQGWPAAKDGPAVLRLRAGFSALGL